MLDTVLMGARVMDPESGLDEICNVGIKDGSIAALERGRLSAAETIDVKGLVCAPGFIDIHTHEDTVGPDALPMHTAAAALKTGNTSIVTGNCGMGPFPFDSYLAHIRRDTFGAQCFFLAGNVSLRESEGVGRYNRADDAQLDRMVKKARAAMQQGALGVSFGLQYAPGTDEREILALCSVAAEEGGFAAFHMRYDYPERAGETVAEVLSAARRTGAKTEISHLAANVYGEGKLALAAKAIMDSGLDVMADVYPYNVWATSIQSAVFDDGFDNFNFDVTDLELLTGPFAGQYCTQRLFEILRAEPEDTMVACHNAMPMEDVEAAYRLPFTMVGSDGQLAAENGRVLGHPRGAGSPARFLKEFVREKQVLSLMEGIRKLTLLPAQRCGLAKKGRIAVGCDADLTLFDPDTIADRSCFGADVCARPPKGIHAVVRAGKVVYRGNSSEA